MGGAWAHVRQAWALTIWYLGEGPDIRRLDPKKEEPFGMLGCGHGAAQIFFRRRVPLQRGRAGKGLCW